jgi:PAS domain S-box-containing protein
MTESTNRRSAPFSGESKSLEETYRSLVESALDPMFTSDADGRYLYVNGAAAAMLGTTPENVVGKTVDELFPPQVAAQYREGVSHVISTGETLITEEKSEINGRPMWFSSIVQPVQNRHGRVQAAQAVVRDITRLKETEQALRESDQRLRQAVRVAHIGIFEHDHTTDSIYLSAELRDIYGLGPEEDLS